jgi:hypothetical protein
MAANIAKLPELLKPHSIDRHQLRGGLALTRFLDRYGLPTPAHGATNRLPAGTQATDCAVCHILHYQSRVTSYWEWRQR